MNRFAGILLLICLALPCQAQEQRATTRSLMFGVGGSKQYDTYLSPSEYRGAQLTVMSQTERQLLRNPNVIYQSNLWGSVASTSNSADTADDFAGNLTYSSAWFRQWNDVLWKNLSLRAGGEVEGLIGFLYNTRNGNNPAQGYLTANAALSVGATQRFHIRRQHFRIAWQGSLPLLGAMFSPQYGQSYYNIFSQGNYDHNVVCTHPGNALCFRQLFTVDIPIRRSIIRMGYHSDIRQAKANDLRQHHYNRTFLIGYVRYFNMNRQKGGLR